jgi:hypothetical protein
VPEVRYGGAWHCFDPGMISYFRKADGTVASVEELVAGVKTWYADHPSCWARMTRSGSSRAIPAGRRARRS